MKSSSRPLMRFGGTLALALAAAAVQPALAMPGGPGKGACTACTATAAR